MIDLQQQIKQLALQLEQLAAQVEKPVEKNEIDLEQLVLETSLQPFEYHPVQEHDEYVKVLYMQTLLSVMNYTEHEQEERYRFVAKIYNGLAMAETFETYVQRSNMITPEQFSRFVSALQENNLTNAFLIDALMVLGIHQEKKALNYVAEIASALGMEEDNFKVICQLALAILQVHHNKVESIVEQYLDLRSASVHYLCAIQPLYSPVLHVIGTGVEKIQAKYLKHKKSVHLENVKINFGSAAFLESIEKIYIKNCELDIDSYLELENADSVHLENLTIRNIDGINIYGCKRVVLKRLRIEDCDIHNYDCLLNIQNVYEFECIDNHFENIKFNVNSISQKETIIKAKNVQQLKEHKNVCKNCEVIKKVEQVSSVLKWYNPYLWQDGNYKIEKIISKE